MHMDANAGSASVAPVAPVVPSASCRPSTRVAELLDEAEGRGECLVASDRHLRNALQHLLKRGQAVRPHPGIYAWASSWQSLDRKQQHLHVMRTLAGAHPDWIFCGPSAALCHGLSVSFASLSRVHVVENESRHHANSSISWHYSKAGEHVAIDGVHVTTLERTTFDCMRSMTFGCALAVADSALRVSRQDRSWLETAACSMRSGYRGAAHARQVATYADGHAESGGESIARAVMLQQGFLMPELQVPVIDRIGGARRRVDFLWRLGDGKMIIGELDGRQKYWDQEMTGGREVIDILADERLRESHLTLAAPVMRFSFADVAQDGGVRLARLMDAFGIPRVRQYCSFDLRPAAMRVDATASVKR